MISFSKGEATRGTHCLAARKDQPRPAHADGSRSGVAAPEPQLRRAGVDDALHVDAAHNAMMTGRALRTGIHLELSTCAPLRTFTLDIAVADGA